MDNTVEKLILHDGEANNVKRAQSIFSILTLDFLFLVNLVYYQSWLHLLTI